MVPLHAILQVGLRLQGEEERKFGKFLFAKKSVVDCMHNKKIWRANKWSKGW